MPINPANEDFAAQEATRKIPPTLIPNPPEDSKVLEEEIFGPLLPIQTYTDFSETIDYVNAARAPSPPTTSATTCTRRTRCSSAPPPAACASTT
jgi:acyl-CoA reductase-like NAD-dependent aldehyde dehydrogenase